MFNGDYERVKKILNTYYKSFMRKTYREENEESDFLMNVYGITPELKRENRQYWGRELGMLWQRIVVDLAEHHCDDFQPAVKCGEDEPCDLVIGQDAIDTKYRVGSGDSGTLKKFKQYGRYLIENKYRPVFLIVRQDNLPAAITAAEKGGWTVYTGKDTIDYIRRKIGVNIVEFLSQYGDEFLIDK